MLISTYKTQLTIRILIWVKPLSTTFVVTQHGHGGLETKLYFIYERLAYTNRNL